MMNVFQSRRDLGEKIFMPLGQLFFCWARETLRHCSHFTSDPAEYGEARTIGEHLHEVGLPAFGFSQILFFWQ